MKKKVSKKNILKTIMFALMPCMGVSLWFAGVKGSLPALILCLIFLCAFALITDKLREV